MLCFCVKDRTGDELRISDWSSDGFSSDLPGPGGCARRPICAPGSASARKPAACRQPASHGRTNSDDPRHFDVVGLGNPAYKRPNKQTITRRTGTLGARRKAEDRKSGGKGRRGSGRVDIGGRRTIKKKN